MATRLGGTGPAALRGKLYSERRSERETQNFSEPLRPVAPIPVAPFKLLRH